MEKIYKDGHNLVSLMRLSNLDRAIDDETRRDRQFGAHWLTVKAWKVESRYEFGRLAIEAQDMFNGVADSDHGILQWLKQHW